MTVVWGSGGGNREKLARGVYPAKWGYIDAEVRKTEKRPDPYVVLYFEASGGMPPLTQDVGLELVRTVSLLTRKDIDSHGSAEEVAHAAQNALAGCVWEGLIYVGGEGFVERLQLPDGGDYRFVFLGWNKKKDGVPNVWMTDPKKWGGKGKPYSTTSITLMVEGGKYDGYVQPCRFACKFDVTPDGGLYIRSDGLKRVLSAFGISARWIAADVEQRGGMENVFPDPHDPFPVFEEMLIRLACEGHRVNGSVRDGKTKWDSLFPTTEDEDGDASPARRQSLLPSSTVDDALLRNRMQALATKMWGEGQQLFDAVGNLTEAGLNLARIVILPLVDVVPGLAADWPPESWSGGQGVADKMAELVGKLVLLDQERLLPIVNSASDLVEFERLQREPF